MTINYAALVEKSTKDIGSGSVGNVQYMKDGDTTVKLVAVNADGKFFESYTSAYKGQAHNSVIISCVILSCSTVGVADKARVRYLKVTTKVVRDLINQMQQGWELLENNANAITLTRGQNSSGKTEYKVSVIKRMFDSTDVALPEQSIEDAAQEQEDRDAATLTGVMDSGEVF